MSALNGKLLSTTIIPALMGVGGIIAVTNGRRPSFNDDTETCYGSMQSLCRQKGLWCCNPCAANACNPCGPCGAAAVANVELEPAEANAAYDCLNAGMKNSYAKSDVKNAGYQYGLEGLLHCSLCIRNPWWSSCEQLPMLWLRKPTLLKKVARCRWDQCCPKIVSPSRQMVARSLARCSRWRKWRLVLMRPVATGNIQLPDSSVFGTTNGENSENVEFCIGCHAAKAALDHIFFVPKGYSKEP